MSWWMGPLVFWLQLPVPRRCMARFVLAFVSHWKRPSIIYMSALLIFLKFLIVYVFLASNSNSGLDCSLAEGLCAPSSMATSSAFDQCSEEAVCRWGRMRSGSRCSISIGVERLLLEPGISAQQIIWYHLVLRSCHYYLLWDLLRINNMMLMLFQHRDTIIFIHYPSYYHTDKRGNLTSILCRRIKNIQFATDATVPWSHWSKPMIIHSINSNMMPNGIFFLFGSRVEPWVPLITFRNISEHSRLINDIEVENYLNSSNSWAAASK